MAARRVYLKLLKYRDKTDFEASIYFMLFVFFFLIKNLYCLIFWNLFTNKLHGTDAPTSRASTAAVRDCRFA